MIIHKTGEREVADLIPSARNARTHSEEQVAQICASIRQFGFTSPILIDERGEIIAGHGRVLALRQLKIPRCSVVTIEGLDESKRRALMLADNRIAANAGWDEALLAEELRELQLEFDPAMLGFDEAELARLLASVPQAEGEGPEDGEDGDELGELAAKGALIQRFGEPPYSVFNARSARWKQRKIAWRDLGIQSELGRDDNLLAAGGAAAYGKSALRHKGKDGEILYSGTQVNTSVFDPVLCELLYLWFTPASGSVLDPFAGGSVRGIVASQLGRAYFGIELREEQVAANIAQLDAAAEPPPVWVCGDSAQLDQLEGLPESFDFIFSCPPYGSLERYSDDPRDLSTMSYADFAEKLAQIIAAACERLKPDRFAAFVVGEFRDKRRGHYYGFVADVIRAFQSSGLELYNEAILLGDNGSAQLRAQRIFGGARKLVKIHQNVLVFVKGDAKAAADACGDPAISWELFESAEGAEDTVPDDE